LKDNNILSKNIHISHYKYFSTFYYLQKLAY